MAEALKPLLEQFKKATLGDRVKDVRASAEACQIALRASFAMRKSRRCRCSR